MGPGGRGRYKISAVGPLFSTKRPSPNRGGVGPAMNFLSRDKQIQVIAALCEGMGVRACSRITGVDRGTVAALALRVGRGAAELHDRLMLGLRVNRLELDELWAFVGKKQRRTTAKD